MNKSCPCFEAELARSLNHRTATLLSFATFGVFIGLSLKTSAGTPDLAPLSLTVLGGSTLTATAPNPRVSVTWAVTNQGTGVASAPWYDRIWFSTNGALDANSVVLGQTYISQELAPGSAYQQTNSVVLPMAGSGAYWLFVQADYYNSVFESNKVNNVSAALPGTFTLTTQAAVNLGIRLDGGQVELFWPTTVSGFHVQRASSLSNGILWVDLPNVPVVVGQEYRVNDGPPTGNQFYRLAR